MTKKDILEPAAVQLIDACIMYRAVGKLGELAHSENTATAKYARRALHILRTKGVDAPVPPRPHHRPGYVPLPDHPIDGLKQGGIHREIVPDDGGDAVEALQALALMGSMGKLRRLRRRSEP